jgi:hypothetical protein
VVPGSQLQSTLEELQELSQQTFLLALQSQVRQQLSECIETAPSDLSPSPGVSQLLNLLREVLSVGSIAEGRQQDLTQVKNKDCVLFCMSIIIIRIIIRIMSASQHRKEMKQLKTALHM